MSASPQDQAKLLDLLRIDQRLSALDHQRRSHPSHATLEVLAGRAEDLRRAAVAQAAVISDIRREASRLETDVERVRARRVTQQARLDANQVPLRDVSAMQHEIARMDQRIAELDDEQLAVEERLEAATAAEAAMRTEAEAIAADVAAAKETYRVDMEEVEAEAARAREEREALAAALPHSLLEDYEYARSRNGALAVIEVRDGLVVGAGAELSPLELDALRRTPADELYWMEGTSQIVVRTTN